MDNEYPLQIERWADNPLAYKECPVCTPLLESGEFDWCRFEDTYGWCGENVCYEQHTDDGTVRAYAYKNQITFQCENGHTIEANAQEEMRLRELWGETSELPNSV